MAKKLTPLIAGAALCAALVIVFLVASGGALSAGAPGALQAATPTPAPVVVASAAPTQTLSADPNDDLTTASVDLHAGYIMDPYLLPVVGKAARPAGDLAKTCTGFTGAEPSVTVNWSGKTDQLNFFLYSDSDGVLAVQLPDGSFVCNDDAGARTIEPLVTVRNPAPGAYRVYAGSAQKDQPALGFLAVSQMALDDAKLAGLDLSGMLRQRAHPVAESLQQLDPRQLLLTRDAVFGSADLQSGFKPVSVFAAGGGDIAAIRVADKKLVCAGYLSAVPSYTFTWTGSPQAMRLYLEGLKDTALAVVTPDEKVLCGMNAADTNANPVVDIPAPSAGKYQVYIAAMEPDTVVGGKLTITPDTRAVPATLAPGAPVTH